MEFICNTCNAKIFPTDDSVITHCPNCDSTDLTILNLSESAKPDNVNHPSHYQTSSGLETFEVIKAFTEDLKGIQAVYTGNVIKYICRWNKKNGLEDLRKAQWYLNHLIEEVENKKKEND